MQHLDQIYLYNNSLKHQILDEIIKVVAISNQKRIYLCKPNNQFEISTPIEVNALIEKYTKKCVQNFSLNEEKEKIYGMLAVNNSFDDFKYLMYSLWYSNLIKLRNPESFNDLEKLYISSFLINYSSKFPIKHRIMHSLCIGEFNSFHKEIRESFFYGMTAPKLIDDITALDYNGLRIDLMGLNGIFWKYCSINATFETIGQSIDLTRYLHELLVNTQEILNKLIFNKKKPLKEIASLGGKAKANHYSVKMNPIFNNLFKLYQCTNPLTGKKWKSKSECVKFFIKDFYLKNPNTEIELDTKKLVEEITIRLNDPFPSRKVSLLAERSVC